MLTWKIAWRNLLRHKGKSLVIGVILFLGAFLMTVGNALIDGAQEGLAENLINRFTGHLVLVAANEKNDEAFFGPPRGVKVLPNYPALKTLLQQQDFIESFLPLTRGDALILNDEGKSGGALVYGVNFDDYQRIFRNNVIPVQGALLQNGDHGILISDKAREKIYDNQKFWIVPAGSTLDPSTLTADARKDFDKGQLNIKTELVILGFSASSLESDIRLPVKGIFRFQSLNNVWAQGVISFMDIESYRECFGYATAAANEAAQLSESQKAALNANTADDFFADAEVVKPSDLKAEGYDLQAMQAQTQRAQTPVNVDQGAYNLVALKLKPGVTLAVAQAQLDQALKAANFPVRILTWKKAVGEISQLATLTQGALVVFVLFIFFVAIIVIMNTLSMAAIERTAEIGMMRAIGARKSFVSKMFLAETTLLSVLFGGLGILIGILTAWGLSALQISLTNSDILSLLFGGDTVHPVVRESGVASGVIQLAIVTLLAVFYPILIARKITPLEAIAKD